MEQRRRDIRSHIPAGDSIVRTRQPVGPWIQERNPGRAALGGSGFEVLQPPQELLASMPQRNTEHAATGQENRLQLTRDELSFVRHFLSLSSSSLAVATTRSGSKPNFL